MWVGTVQEIVFKPAEKGTRKVIVATNIAETSVTIPVKTLLQHLKNYTPEMRIGNSSFVLYFARGGWPPVAGLQKKTWLRLSVLEGELQ